MLSCIARHLWSTEYGPFDRLLEMGVFLLIAYEVVVNVVRHRKDHKREKHLSAIVRSLTELMDKGQQLRWKIPNPTEYGPTQIVQERYVTKINEWLILVAGWREETNRFMLLHSVRASTTFLLVVNSHAIDNLVTPPNGWSFTLSGHIREMYQLFVAQLDNLRNIAERPEAYF